MNKLTSLVEKLNGDKKELKEKNMRLIAENENLKHQVKTLTDVLKQQPSQTAAPAPAPAPAVT